MFEVKMFEWFGPDHEPPRVHRRLWSSPAFVESSSWIPHATTVSCRASNSTGVSIPSAL